MKLPQAKAFGGVGVRSGVVTPSGCALRDDQGLFHPLGLTFFWAMQGWKSDRDRFKQNAEWVAEKGFDYVRILTEVGWGSGLEIDPTSERWSDWGVVLREVIDYFYSLGVRVELTLLGKGTRTDPIWLAQEVGAIVHDNREHMIMDIETANEFSVGSNGPSMGVMRAMARALTARVPNIVALSSPSVEEWQALRANALAIKIHGYTVHPSRRSADYNWRMVRQGYDAKNFKPLVTFVNEPAGPGSSVNVLTNPLHLAMLRAVHVMCGASGFVLHTGTGVFGDGKPHPTAGARPANFWEIDDIDAVVKALHGVGTLLPENVENWTVANTGWRSPLPIAPFQPHEYWEGSRGEGVNKAYSALAPDGRVIQMPIGVRGHVKLTASYPLRDVVVYDPLSLQPVSGLPESFDKGQTMDLPGGGEDAMVAYIIHGQRA